jgi:hypothetical protein
MCTHLQVLENYIKEKKVAETFRGKAWSNNCNEWVYFDCILDTEKLKEKLNLDKCIKTHDYIDIKVANELGLVCETCKDGIMGQNPKSPLTKNKITVD